MIEYPRRSAIVEEVKRRVPGYEGGTTGLLPSLSVEQWEALLDAEHCNSCDGHACRDWRAHEPQPPYRDETGGRPY